MKSKIILLWLSAIGSTILALYVIFAIGFILYSFLLKSRFAHVGFHFNENWLSWFVPIIIWLLFPLIYLWLRHYKSKINKNKLFKYCAYSNATLIITPPLFIIITLLLNEV